MSTAAKLVQDLVARGWVSAPLMKHLRADEGYRGMPYTDTLGKPTIGVGCLLPLSEDESMLLAAVRAADGSEELEHALERIGITFIDLRPELRDALRNAAFQLGVPKLMGFRRMWAALANEDWNEAADEALDSKWAREQTPKRAQHLATVLRSQRA